MQACLLFLVGVSVRISAAAKRGRSGARWRGFEQRNTALQTESSPHIPAPMPPVVFTILFNIFLVLHIIVCLLLGLVVLMQRPKQEGLGAAFAGGMMNESFGAQTTDVLQKATRFLAIAFFVLATLMAIVKAQQNKLDTPITAIVPEAPAETQPDVPPSGTLDLESILPPADPASTDTPAPEPGVNVTDPAATDTGTDADGEGDNATPAENNGAETEAPAEPAPAENNNQPPADDSSNETEESEGENENGDDDKDGDEPAPNPNP